MGSISILGHFLIIHHRVTRTAGEDGCGDTHWHITYPANNTAVFPTIHAHRGILDMVLFGEVCINSVNMRGRADKF